MADVYRIIEEADVALDKGRINLGEYNKIIQPWRDAEPIKHGRWIWKNYYLVCSECGKENDRTDYCPNCGAKMDLDEVEE